MTVVNCPLCELRFATRTERDWHLSNEHLRAHVRPPAKQTPPWTHHPPTHPSTAVTEPDTEDRPPAETADGDSQ